LTDQTHGHRQGFEIFRKLDLPGAGAIAVCNDVNRSLRVFRVLTQGPSRGPRGADEPRAIAKPAGCDGNGS
jgi:hypothetical protein